MVIAYPVVVLVLGAVLFYACNGPSAFGTKTSEVGRVMFAMGLLVALLSAVAHPLVVR